MRDSVVVKDMRVRVFVPWLLVVLSFLVVSVGVSSAQASPASKARYKLAESADVRILDDNIWDYSQDTIPPKWKAMGEDPRDFVRAPQFERLITDYMPDVLTLQEYSSHMHDELYPRIAKEGYVIAWESGKDWNNTPVFYHEKTMEPLYVKYHKYTPAQWCNRGTKSFTSIVLKRKSDGRVFSVVNTHLWWKSDQMQPGSTMARASQLRLIMAEVEIIRARFGSIPVFVVGDMNCEEKTVPLQQMIAEGYVPCYKVAVKHADNSNGHHVCGPDDGFSTESRRAAPDRENGAIDHCLLLDTEGKTEVIVFDCIMDEYTVKITDHYPLLVDFKL